MSFLTDKLQVRFALSLSPVFSRTDTATDSERFYNSVLDLFEDPEEREDVNELLTWWNWYVVIHRFYGALSLSFLHQADLPQLFVSATSGL